MVITKTGTPPNKKLWQGRCAECGTEATALGGELSNITRMGTTRPIAWEPCPVCHAENMPRYGSLTYKSGTMIFYEE